MLIIKVPDQFIVDITPDFFALDSQLKSWGFRPQDQTDSNITVYEDRLGKIESNLRLYVFTDVTPPLNVEIQNYVVWFKLTETQYLGSVPSYFPDNAIYEMVGNVSTFVRYKTWGELMRENYQGNDVANNGFHYVASNINGQVLTNFIVSQAKIDGFAVIDNEQFKLERP